ncbi:hypothetical protein TRFO_14542 [Tritrichomonas foetus]|uniref:Uncharacterized protein n=1 Tax=Tritrichomonas foetus TaxID=1144522 RepID=A0A1J4KUS8_9EUKA|nr:hypothetical protein TRFO_14542 [Tritrichomonas foetus]|eukprot:OHT15035.1 hypothetical protein TRFO_14542 [Tritrichomonas foetus]
MIKLSIFNAHSDKKLIFTSTDGRDLFSYEFCKCEVKGQIKVKSGKNLMGKCDVNFAGSLGHFDMEEVRHVNTAEGAKRSEAVVTWQHLFQWPNESKGPAKSHHIYPFLVSKNKTHRKKNPASTDFVNSNRTFQYFTSISLKSIIDKNIEKLKES